MNRRVVAVAALVVSATVAGSACSQTVSGSAQRAVGAEGSAARGYGYAADRCGLLLDTTVADAIGANHMVRPYTGAVCQYVASRQGKVIDVTFSWFETGSLQRERALADQDRAQIRDVVVQRHSAFLARRSVTGTACSATAATNPGVASWWVQVRDDPTADPCTDAEKLLAKTLTSDL